MAVIGINPPPIDLLNLFWLLSSLAIGVAHVVFNTDLKLGDLRLTNALIKYIKPLYYFGKVKVSKLKSDSRGDDNGLIFAVSSIPKRCFSHFYITGVFIHTQVFVWMTLHIFRAASLPNTIQGVLDLIRWNGIVQDTKAPPRSPWPLWIVLACEEIHLLRRIYESLRVSSFSKGTISIVHYFYGVVFYILFGVGVSAAGSVKDLSLTAGPETKEIVLCSLGVSGFIVASYFQHKALKTFASLRIKEKDSSAQGHYIPHGHLFSWVSSPHYLCEILLYLSLCIILQWQNSYMICATVFVIVNQVSAALTVHNWYIQTFPKYPRHRRAIFPYIL